MINEKDDDLDLLNVVVAFWRVRYAILAINIACIAFGVTFALTRPITFETIIPLQPHSMFYDSNDLIKKFEGSFFDKENFNSWKKIRANTTLTFDFIDPKISIDGLQYETPPDSRVIKVVASPPSIVITSNEFDLSFVIRDYAQFINEELEAAFVDDKKKSQSTVRNLLNEEKIPLEALSDLLLRVIELELDLMTIENSEFPFMVDNPLVPHKGIDQTYLFIGISIVSGVFLSFLLVIILNLSAMVAVRLEEIQTAAHKADL